MNIGDWLVENTKKLADVGISTARLDCLVLLEDATGKDRAYLLAHPETIVTGPTCNKLNKQVERRAGHEPLAYIRGKTEFYGREFIISKHVLEPRPESETMVELLKQLVNSRQFTVFRSTTSEDRKQSTEYSNLLIVDVGTGSGALAITAKLEFPDAKVIATDVDSKCLKVARQNAKKLGAKIEFYQGNLLNLLPPSDFRLPTSILANLPYVPDNFKLNSAAVQEPKIAIFGGPDGLDLYRQLFNQLSQNKQFTGVKYVLTESLPPQHPTLAMIAEKHGYKQYQEDDFIQIFVKN